MQIVGFPMRRLKYIVGIIMNLLVPVSVPTMHANFEGLSNIQKLFLMQFYET